MKKYVKQMISAFLMSVLILSTPLNSVCAEDTGLHTQVTLEEICTSKNPLEYLAGLETKDGKALEANVKNRYSLQKNLSSLDEKEAYELLFFVRYEYARCFEKVQKLDLYEAVIKNYEEQKEETDKRILQKWEEESFAFVKKVEYQEADPLKKVSDYASYAVYLQTGAAFDVQVLLDILTEVSSADTDEMLSKAQEQYTAFQEKTFGLDGAKEESDVKNADSEKKKSDSISATSEVLDSEPELLMEANSKESEEISEKLDVDSNMLEPGEIRTTSLPSEDTPVNLEMIRNCGVTITLYFDAIEDQAAVLKGLSEKESYQLLVLVQWEYIKGISKEQTLDLYQKVVNNYTSKCKSKDLLEKWEEEAATFLPDYGTEYETDKKVVDFDTYLKFLQMQLSFDVAECRDIFEALANAKTKGEMEAAEKDYQAFKSANTFKPRQRSLSRASKPRQGPLSRASGYIRNGRTGVYYDSLNKAGNEANSGDVIYINGVRSMSGIWTLPVGKTVYFIPEGGDVYMNCDTPTLVQVLGLDNSDTYFLKNGNYRFFFNGNFAQTATDPFHSIIGTAGRLTLEGCRFYNSNGLGVGGLTGSEVYIKDCAFYNNTSTGLLSNSYLSVDGCSSYSNGEDGILCMSNWTNSGASIRNTNLYNNGRAGIAFGALSQNINRQSYASLSNSVNIWGNSYGIYMTSSTNSRWNVSTNLVDLHQNRSAGIYLKLGNTVTLDNATRIFSNSGNGGILMETGTVNLNSGSNIFSNSSDWGGGIKQLGGTVNVNAGSGIYSNSASQAGGGVYMGPQGGNTTLNIPGGSIYSNVAPAGAGVYHDGAALNMSGTGNVHTNNVIQLGDGRFVNVTGALSNIYGAAIVPCAYTLGRMCAQASYGSWQADQIYGKFILPYAAYQFRPGNYAVGIAGSALIISQPYTVAYNKNSSLAVGNMPGNGIKYWNENYTLPGNIPTLTGYNFRNWSTNPTSATGNYAPGAGLSYNTNGNVTFYAIWAKNAYTIRYQGNGGSGAMADTPAAYGTAVNLRGNTFSRSGYVFKNWNTRTDGTGTAYGNGQSVSSLTSTNGAVVTLYAQWTPNPYSIRYLANGGTGAMADTGAIYDTAVVLRSNTFTKTGYTFKQWNTRADGTGTAHSNTASVKNLTAANGGIVTLYAQWTPNTYTVKYQANAGTGTMPDSQYTYDKAAALTKNTYKKIFCEFSGWSMTATGNVLYTDQETIRNLSSKNQDTISLYAVWRELPIRIVYKGNDEDSGTSKSEVITKQDCEDNGGYYTVRKNKNYTNYERSGHTFFGWDVKPEKHLPTLPYLETKSNHIPFAELQELAKKQNTIGEKELTVTLYAQYDKAATITTVAKTVVEGETIVRSDLLKDIIAVDEEDGDITDRLIITEIAYAAGKLVDGKKAGEYIKAWPAGMPDTETLDTWFMQLDKEDGAVVHKITYQVTDSAGNTTRNTAEIKVKYNEFPIIETRDRYFTLQEAQGGVITEELLNSQSVTEGKLEATDEEEGVLSDKLTLVEFHPEDFTSFMDSGFVTVTYRVTDTMGPNGAGKETLRQTRIYIVKDGERPAPEQTQHVRFISQKYYDKNKAVDPSGLTAEERAALNQNGGLNVDSKWYQEDEYRTLLERTFAKKDHSPDNWGTFFYPIHGTEKQKGVNDIQEYIEAHDIGNSQELDALDGFYEEFMKNN